MIRRLIRLGAVVALLGAGDVAARTYVETKVDARAQAEAPAESTVHARVGGFPFLPRLLLNSTVSHVGVHVENLNATVITFATVDIDLRGVHLDRAKMFAQTARVTSIDSGNVDAVLTQDELSEALHIPVTIADGAVNVRVLGVNLAVIPSVNDNGLLTLRPAGIAQTLTLRIPKTPYVPCIGSVTVLAARLRFSCAIHEIPPALIDVAQIKSRSSAAAVVHIGNEMWSTPIHFVMRPASLSLGRHSRALSPTMRA